MLKHITQNKKGVSLIETVIYTTIIALMAISIVTITVSFLQTKNKNQATILLEGDMRFALWQMKEALRSASDITLPASGAGSTLTLTMSDPAKNPTTFNLSSDKITKTEGTGTATNLTSSSIKITTLNFTRLTSTPPAVIINMIGELPNPAQNLQTTYSLSETVVIRR